MKTAKEMKSTWDRIFEYNNDLAVTQLKNLYSVPSFFETLGFDRIEALHSNFIAWLLDNQHLGQGKNDNAMTRFLDVVVKNNYAQNAMVIDTDFINAVASRSMIIKEVHVDKEVTYKDKENNHRIDLIVTCDININNIDKELVVYIENKVCAPETFNKKANINQTQIYYEQYYSENAGQIQWFVFLSPSENAECDCDKFIRITYKDLLLYVLEPMVVLPSINERDRMFIREYIRALGAQVLKNQGMGFVMAITNEERIAFSQIYEKYKLLFRDSFAAKISDQYKNSSPQTINKWKKLLEELDLNFLDNPDELLVAFWDNNSSFIINAIDLSDDCRRETLLKMIADVSKDRTRYRLSYKDNHYDTNKNHLASELVKAYIAINNLSDSPKDMERLKTFFSGIREPFIIQSQPDKDKLFDRIGIGESSIWIPNGVWGQGTRHFEKLLKKARDINGLTID